MVRILFVVVALLLGVFYYYFLGAGPSPSELFDDLEWWRPRGWLLRADSMMTLAEMADAEGPQRMVPVALFWIAPLALVIGGFMLFKSAVMRALIFWLGLNLCIIAYYGTIADRVWRFFEWRFVAVAASMATVLTVILFGPSLLRALGKIPRVISGVVLLALFAGVFMLQTEITGTDSDLRFNITPWPVVTVFGMLILGFMIASMHLAAGAGLWVSSRAQGVTGWAAGLAVTLVLAVALCFYVFTDPTFGVVAVFAMIGAAYMVVAHALAHGERTPLPFSGTSRVAAAVVVFVMVGASDYAAKQFQKTARNETAQVVLVALEDYKKVHKEYPERLKHLVPDYLDELPKPQIGLILDEDDEFEYSNFGDSFALEFASVQWVQCAYSPPYEFAAYEDEGYESAEGYADEDQEEDDGEAEAWEEDYDVAAGPKEVDPELAQSLRDAGLEGSWNCAEEPPKVW